MYKNEMEFDCRWSIFANIDIISKLSLYWFLIGKNEGISYDSVEFIRFTAFWKHNKST